jgi:hypothetical protein
MNYDAAYLELAIRSHVVLATTDEALRDVAKSGVPLLENLVASRFVNPYQGAVLSARTQSSETELRVPDKMRRLSTP